MIENVIKNAVTAIASLNVVNLENLENQNSEIAANTSEAGTKYLSVFSPNAGKYGPEIIPYLDTFHAVNLYLINNVTIKFIRVFR